MDSQITAAAHALAAGDALGALNQVALRDDPAALALRGVAMAQLGALGRARSLIRAAARGFGPTEAVARARCLLAEAEIALASRDLVWPEKGLDAARRELAARGDLLNAEHARNLEIRRLLLIGRLVQAERLLAVSDAASLPPALRAVRELAAAGIAIRQLRVSSARAALAMAGAAAREARIVALVAEVEHATGVLDAPAARIVARTGERIVRLDEVEELIGSGALVVDACRNAVRQGEAVVPLATRPVLFSLARALAEAWPGDASRETLLTRAFRAKHADESHRVRLRVEIGRLRAELRALADIAATRGGFALRPHRTCEVVVLAPPVEERHAEVLALLADGELWSSSALAIALGIGPRTVQRALEELAASGRVVAYGQGRSRRWTTPAVPRFPSPLLLPGLLPGG